MYGETASVATPKKFRIVCEEYGFLPHSIKTWIQGSTLFVTGLVELVAETGLYTKEFQRAYHLPEHLTLDTERLVKLFTERGQLIIEMPIVEEEEYLAIGGGARFGGAFAHREQKHGLKQHENVHVTVNMLVKEHGEEKKTFVKPSMGMMEINYKRPEEFLPAQYARFGVHTKRTIEQPMEQTFEVAKQQPFWGQQQQKFANYKPTNMEYNQYKSFGF